MNKSILPILVTTIITGCALHNSQLYAPIDNANKTVTVSSGSAGLNGDLKRILAKEGWTLYVYQGPSVTEGVIGEKSKIVNYNSFNSRYRLLVTDNQYDWCLNMSPAITYDISYIDNKSGTEVFTMSGRGCQSHIVKKFTELLHGEK